MVSPLPLCLLIIAVSAASIQSVPDDTETPFLVAEKRTFKHKKPTKFLPLIKKHKKFVGWVSNPYRTEYAEVPVIHEVSRPIYKIHRYHGVEVKPVSTPEPIIESHPVVHSSDPEPIFSSDHSYSGINSFPSSSFLLYPVNDKPIFNGPPLPTPIFSSPPPDIPSLPDIHHVSLPQRPIFSFIPASQPAPVLQSLPFSLSLAPIPPAFPPIPLAKPTLNPVITSHSLPPQPAPPAFFSVPTPAPLPVPTPTPAPVLPEISVSTPSPAPAFQSIAVSSTPAPLFPIKIPQPIFPALQTPSPAPILPSISVSPSPPVPVFPAVPSFSLVPTASPLPTLPSPAPSLAVSAAPEPEYPYPPSGSPIPSYIKDISLPVTESTPINVATPNYEEHPSTISDDEHKNIGVIKTDHGFLQKLKDWKAEKANAALNHFHHFRQKPVSVVHPHFTATTLAPPHLPSYPSLQFPGPLRPLPLTPDFRPPAVFLPHQSQFISPVKYESFPPNHIEPPPLYNSYGVPIPHDSYAPPQISHDRLSPDASEEEPSILLPPSTTEQQNQEQILKEHQQPQQSKHDSSKQAQVQLKTLQSQSFLSQEHPVYVPEDNKTVKDEVKPVEIVLPVRSTQDGQETQEQEDFNLKNHRKE